MPQLDKISFMSQYLWLTIFFYLIYFIVFNFFAINIFKSLKMRQIISLFNLSLYNNKIFNENLISISKNIKNRCFYVFYNCFLINFIYLFSIYKKIENTDKYTIKVKERTNEI